MSLSSALWQQLKEKGLVSGEQPVEQQLSSPWFVKTLLAFCGWLAAVFIFAFLAAAFNSLLDSATGCMIVGVLLMIAAWKWLAMPHSDFLEHLALASSLAGQSLLIYALFVLLDLKEVQVWGIICLIQMILACVIANFVHRICSTFFAAFAFASFAAILNITPVAEGGLILFMAWLWLNEFRFPRHSDFIIPVGYGLVLTLIMIKGAGVFHYDIGWKTYSADIPWWAQASVGEILHSLVLLYVSWQLLSKYAVALKQPLVIFCLASVLVLSLLSMQAQGLTLGIMILLLGFAGSNYVLQALGLISLLFYLSTYYYLLDITLLDKSKTLMLIGLMMLAVRYLMKRLQGHE